MQTWVSFYSAPLRYYPKVPEMFCLQLPEEDLSFSYTKEHDVNVEHDPVYV